MKLNRSLTTCCLLALCAGTVFAQPTVNEDYGQPTPCVQQSHVISISSDVVNWYAITLPSVSQGDGNFFDISTAPANGYSGYDTMIGVYDAAGTRIGFDDDDGEGFYSAMSFGLSSPTRPLTGGVAFNGRDGALAGGTYYVAVGNYFMTFPTSGFAVVSNGYDDHDCALNFTFGAAQCPTPPAVTGSGTGGDNCGFTSAFVSATVIEGGNPTSTGLVVTGDFSALGGSATQTMTDNGGGYYTYDQIISSGTAPGTRTVVIRVVDAQGRTASTNVNVAVSACPPQNAWTEVDDAGQTLDSYQEPVGSGILDGISGTTTADASNPDLYLIEICDPAGFSATTVGFTTLDTQLFLFNLDGTGIAVNDDSVGGVGLQSTLTSALTASLPAGQYFLALSGYNADPVDEFGQFLWLNTPFQSERAPDGPGAGNSLFGWSGSAFGSGSYTIVLTGCTYPGSCGGGGGCPACPADFNDDGGVDGGDVEAFFVTFSAGESCADVNQDGGVDGSDIESFFGFFSAGGC